MADTLASTSSWRALLQPLLPGPGEARRPLLPSTPAAASASGPASSEGRADSRVASRLGRGLKNWSVPGN